MDDETRQRIIDAAWKRQEENNRAELARLREQVRLLIRRVADLEEMIRMEPTRKHPALEPRRAVAPR